MNDVFSRQNSDNIESNTQLKKDSNKEGNYICYNAFMDFLDENPKYSAIYYAKKEIFTSNLPIVIDVHVKNLPNDVEVIVNLIRD